AWRKKYKPEWTVYSFVVPYWLVLPDLRSIYVFSAPGEYQSFNKEDKLEDPRLEVEVELGDVFR
ncbi:MAG: hypothetical protein KDD28_10930, partial [Phaeodactylibacter sp.]|nr:hypothetical protein [Phaeodactylibacter sp.]